MKPVILIPVGDAAGIGPEIIIKALLDAQTAKMARCVVVGDAAVLEQAMAFVGIQATLQRIDGPEEYQEGVLNVIDQKNIDLGSLRMGEVQAMTGQAAYEAIIAAATLCMEGRADVLTTTAINKESLRAAKVPYIGHTEILSSVTGVKNPLTMFQVRGLRVFFLSRHISLHKACGLVTKENLEPFIERCAQALRILGEANPHIAIAGLNPHSGEHGLFGREEVDAVAPAVLWARERGMRIDGPVSADNVFHFALCGRYDAVLSLYHDQGHIATKMVDFERTISITNGLPFLRTSVDHGTALDIAGKGIASPVSLMEAIRLGALYAPHFCRDKKH